MKNISINMDKKAEFYQKMKSLVIPIALQQFMFAAVSASDALMLSFIAQEDLSAVSLAGQVQFIYSLFLFAITTGATLLIAQYWGKGDNVTIEKVFAIVIRLSVLVSAIFFLASLLFPRILMRVFTPDEILIEKGAEYLKIASPTFLLTGISQMYFIIMKNTGYAMKSTVINATAMLLDLVLNMFFIYGLWFFPRMGIAGAALTTVISRMVELAWIMLDYAPKSKHRLRFKYIVRPDKTLARDFRKYTAPVMGNELVWGGGFAAYTVIMGHMGGDAVAASSIANIVKNLLICICAGISSGGGIVVGNELGKGDLVTAKYFGKKVLQMATVSGIVTGGFVLVSSFFVTPLFKLSPQATEYLRVMLIMCSYYVAGKAINMATIAGIFSAGGDTKFGFICDAITMWAFAVPLGLIAAFWLKLPVLWVYFILNLDEIVKLPAVFANFRKYKWVKDLTNPNLE